MYKVININIGGRIFQVEENAFEMLNQYLNALKNYFSNKPEGNEIVSDIENRIAELLLEKLKNGQSNITNEHVSEIIASVGSPKDIAGDEETVEQEQTKTSQQQHTQNFETTRTKIFRDPDGKIISGVCSGLAYYFNIDPLIMRLIFIALFFAGGSSILIYFILLIVIPVARTTAEKLAMRKEKINIDTIQKSVENEFGRIKEDFKNKNFQDKGAHFLRSVFNAIGVLMRGVFKLASRFMGLIFGIIALSFFVSTIVGITGNVIINGHPTNIVNILSLYFFENTNDRILAQVVLVLTLFSFTLTFFYWSSLLLTDGRAFNKSKVLIRTIATLWILTIVLMVISAAKTGTYFTTKSSIEKTISLDSTQKKFIIKTFKGNKHYRRFEFENKDIKIGDIELLIEETDGPAEIIQVISAYGHDIAAAKNNASYCEFKLEIKDSIITFPENFILSKNQQYRKQEILFILKLPRGSQFRIDDDANIEINSHSDDAIYTGNAYKIDEEGINCTDCESYGSALIPSDYRINYSVGDFNKIKVSSIMKVKIMCGTDRIVKAKGINDKQEIIVEVENGVLNIHLRHESFMNRNKEVEVIVVCPELNSLEVSGMVEAHFEGFHNDNITIDCSGASECFANITPDALTVETSGTSELNLSGNCLKLNISCSGTSQVDAADFVVKDIQIKTSGTSEAQINATDNMEANASGVSKIIYQGEPKHIKTKAAGMSEIEKKD